MMRAALRGWQVNEPPLPVCDAQIDDLPAVAQLVSLPHFGFYSLSSPRAALRGERERRKERGEPVPGERSHSFIFIFTRHMFACQKEEGGGGGGKSGKQSIARRGVRACVELRVDSTRVVSSSEGLRASAAPRTPEPPNIKAHWEPSRHKEPIYAEITRCKSFQEE